MGKLGSWDAGRMGRMGGPARDTGGPRLQKSIWTLYTGPRGVIVCGNDQQSDDAMP